MKALVDAALSDRWNRIQNGQTLRTPDIATGSNFAISSISPSKIVIQTQGGTVISIDRDAFTASLIYLINNKHDQNNRCDIASNKDISQAGPLCVTARKANGVNVMVITYILPILAQMGLVEIDGSRPNRTWLC